MSKSAVLKILILSFPILFPEFYMGQEKDSINSDTPTVSQKVEEAVSNKFPMARLINVEYTQSMPYNFSSKYLQGILPEGKVNNLSSVKISSNINIIRKKDWSMGATLNYNYLSATVDAINPFDVKQIIDQAEDFHYHATSLNASYYSKLFNKTMIYSGVATVDGSNKNFERVRGVVTATMVLKATADTKMTIGMVGLIDPNAIVPAFLSFSYEHHFSNGIVIDAILPKWMYVRKNISHLGRLSVGTELGGTMFYLYNNDRAYTFSQLDLNSGLLYEHRLGNSFIASLKTGVRLSPSSRVMDKQASFKDYVLDSKPDPSFYFNVGISFNPFKAKR
ncbi:DUF6268 family outer membrane beta-barrel protein [Chryseobacterium fluminis]|uniref:DUF6268 family outer membrane beta-barrel protein n=1 Tax=Chryseobacterium fluminis TaxID=2983606 RepID=UPI00225B0694|nr:DUF6268 family outer membrane beta-barrel protein [Chryseobacterium sp. MMS21-Ot14]UZT99057.1 DUF6268 family outer membrane beta-barrel protein [Chryseobacterium sp. MMS21-Ot14]